MGVAVLVVFPINATLRPVSASMVVGTVRWSAAIGGCVGFVLGVFEARAISRTIEIERLNERARIQLDEARTDQEIPAYVTQLLTEEIRPLVAGIGEEVRRSDGGTVPETESIGQRIRQLETMLGYVETVLTTSGSEGRLVPRNLAAAVRTAASEFADERPDANVTITTGGDGGEEPFVRADRSLRRLFVDLFGCLCARSEHPAPEVSVAVRTKPDAVRVRTRDNDAGVPDNASAFDHRLTPKGSDDPELELIGMLVRHYGGTIRVDEGTQGSVVEIELKRVLIEAAPTDRIEGKRITHSPPE